MHWLSRSVLTIFIAAASAGRAQTGERSWNLTKFTSLVAFGDSYTDESRYGYFAAHNGSAPPVGWVDPESFSASDGGIIWARWVSIYTGANLYDYAVSGAVCSNDLVPRNTSGGFDYPAVEQYEIPAYIADSQYTEPNGTKFLDIPQNETVYSMWIGTNDLGTDAFLTDSQINNSTLVDYLNCVYDQFDRIYANGGRYFILQNNAPLQLAPMYSLPDNAGEAGNQNATELHYRMEEDVVLTNSVYQYRTPYELLVANRYPGAHFAIYDIYGLMSDIYYNPSKYLNGSAPLNVTGYVDVCNANNTCVEASSPDSYMWYNTLHPSQQTDRIIAQNFVDVVSGNGIWATYWSS
ncbi:MAG: hypothetical protein M1821_008063 [Bathelium mastoideum]|nr:MAG: hypothetical protein M1821_008063 [Bathelium mastoideum]